MKAKAATPTFLKTKTADTICFFRAIMIKEKRGILSNVEIGLEQKRALFEK